MAPSESKFKFSELSAVPMEASDSRVSSSEARGSSVSISNVSSSLQSQPSPTDPTGPKRWRGERDAHAPRDHGGVEPSSYQPHDVKQHPQVGDVARTLGPTHFSFCRLSICSVSTFSSCCMATCCCSVTSISMASSLLMVSSGTSVTEGKRPVTGDAGLG